MLPYISRSNTIENDVFVSNFLQQIDMLDDVDKMQVIFNDIQSHGLLTRLLSYITAFSLIDMWMHDQPRYCELKILSKRMEMRNSTLF